MMITPLITALSSVETDHVAVRRPQISHPTSSSSLLCFTIFLFATYILFYFALLCNCLFYFVTLSFSLYYFALFCFTLLYFAKQNSHMPLRPAYFVVLCFSLLYFVKQISQVPLRPAPLTAARTNRPIKEPFRGRNLHFS